jgi:hypothetical protein
MKAFHLNAGIKVNLFAIKMDFCEPFMTYIDNYPEKEEKR